MVWYEGTGTSDKRFIISDHQGSVIATTNAAGSILNISTYSPYGERTNTNAAYASRFGYTGQADLPELNLQYYKARIYDPKLGRFLQSDPIGYEAGMNIYAYVLGDPVNAKDPLGLSSCTLHKTTTTTTSIDSKGHETITISISRDIESQMEYRNPFDETSPTTVKLSFPDLFFPMSRFNCGGQKGPRMPDFYSVNIEKGFGKLSGKSNSPYLDKFGFGGGATIDRFGQFYAHAGGSLNKTNITGASRSAVAGYMLQDTVPTPQQLSNFLTGSADSVVAGNGPGGGLVWNKSGAAAVIGYIHGASAGSSKAGNSPKQLTDDPCIN